MKKITVFIALLLVSGWASAQMAGTYKVGTGEVAPNFSSLKAATTALNASTITGDIILEITSDITELENIGLFFNSEFSLTIRPDTDADRTITFNHAADDNSGPSGSLCIGIGTSIAWADLTPTKNITIDGYAVGGTTRRLKIATAATHNGTNAPIVLLDDCSNIQIKNCIIHHVGSSTGSGNYGIYLRVNASQGTKKMPSNVTIENNIITATQNTASQAIAVYANGTPTSIATGIIIKDNIINARTRGLFLYYLDGIEISGNEFNIEQTATGVLSSAIYGVSGLTGDVMVKSNKFNTLKTWNSTTGDFGMKAIIASGGGTWYIENNFFSGLDKVYGSAETNNYSMLQYIRVGSTCVIQHNTFYMKSLTKKPVSNVANPTANDPSYSAINIAAGTPEISNNIFISDESTVPNYFVRGTNGGVSDNNVFYYDAANTMAFINGEYATLESYQTGSGKDANSKFVNVAFEDAANGDLRIAGLSVQDNNLAVPRLATVLKDMFGTDRAETTYAGAHESTLPFTVTAIDETTANVRIIRTASGVEVQLDREANIELYSINGMLIDKVRTNGMYSKTLNNGVYIIRINGKSTKFIK